MTAERPEALDGVHEAFLAEDGYSLADSLQQLVTLTSGGGGEAALLARIDGVAHDGGLTGTVGEAFGQTDSRVDTWIADGVRRKSGTARTLTAAADLLEQTAGRLTWTKLEFIRRGVQAVNLELTRPSVDVMVRAAAAVVPLPDHAERARTHRLPRRGLVGKATSPR